MVKTPLDMTKEKVFTEKRIPRDSVPIAQVSAAASVEVSAPAKKKSKKSKIAA